MKKNIGILDRKIRMMCAVLILILCNSSYMNGKSPDLLLLLFALLCLSIIYSHSWLYALLKISTFK